MALTPSGADAAILAVIQNLSFGQSIIRDNDSVHDLTVQRNGMIAHDPELIPLIDPQRAELLLITLPTSTQVSVIIPDTTLTAPSGRFFTLSSFDTNSPDSGILGQATIFIGATLSTSGNGIDYISETFNGNIDITFSW